jgi:flagellar motor switch protein FliN/FliY
MGNDNVLDQNEIERLLGGMGGSASPPPPPAAAPEVDGVLNQSELDALFGNVAAAPASASAGPLDQTELDSLFSGGAPAAPPGGQLDQAELNALFGGGAAAAPKPATPVPPPASAPKPAKPAAQAAFAAPPTASAPLFGGGAGSFSAADTDEEDNEGVTRGDLDYLMKRADDSLRSIASVPMDLPTEVFEFQFPEFGGTVPSTEHATLDQISEVELDVKIELGRTNMYLEDILKLRKGSVVPLDKMAGDTVDIFINGRLLARGEVLVMNENFCVRVAELLAGAIPMEF